MFWLSTGALREQALIERRVRLSLEEAYRGTLHALSATLDLRDDDTNGHSQRVMEYALAVGRRLELPEADMQTLAWGALLHDLGKIGIRDTILLKPGPLTAEERAIMNQHVVIGQQLVRNIPFLAHTQAMIRHHHERYDGTGYPDQLAGEAIPLVARIFAVVDAYDAMTSPRPDRPVPLTVSEARTAIERNAGGQFCPRVVAAFLRVGEVELDQIHLSSQRPDQGPAMAMGYTYPLPKPVPAELRDELTGALNHRAWVERLGGAAGERPLGAVAVVSLHGLERVYTDQGRLAGDRIVADLSYLLIDPSREVYRIHSNRFALLAPRDAWRDGDRDQLVRRLVRYEAYWRELGMAVAVCSGWASGPDRRLPDLVAEAMAGVHGQETERGE